MATIKWRTRHEWKTKPGVRDDGYIILLLEPHSTTWRMIMVSEDMEDIPKCWRWAYLYQVVNYASRNTLDIKGYDV